MLRFSLPRKLGFYCSSMISELRITTPESKIANGTPLRVGITTQEVGKKLQPQFLESQFRGKLERSIRVHKIMSMNSHYH